jgi:hypothetical protein
MASPLCFFSIHDNSPERIYCQDDGNIEATHEVEQINGMRFIRSLFAARLSHLIPRRLKIAVKDKPRAGGGIRNGDGATPDRATSSLILSRLLLGGDRCGGSAVGGACVAIPSKWLSNM